MPLLEASICDCGQIYLPSRVRCIKCLNHTNKMQITNKGKILTYTILDIVPTGFSAPLILGLVEMNIEFNKKDTTLANIKPKLVCQGKLDDSKLKIGLEVQVKKENNLYYFM